MNSLQQWKQTMLSGNKVTAWSRPHLMMHALSVQARRIIGRLNRAQQPKKIERLFRRLTGNAVGARFGLFPPFYTDCGKNIYVGNDVFINSGCCFQDQGGIFLGDGCLIGQQVVIATLNHDEDPTRRADLTPAPVRIGKGVWIGAKAMILPGVTIGENSVIGAGAVVTKDIPADSVAVGNPARVIRAIKREQGE